MDNTSILIVDDENFVCENIKLKIARLQHDTVYDVVTCNSASRAMQIYEEKKFDLIFTDIKMPFIDGISLIKKLRAAGYTGVIYVLSGYDDFDNVRRAFLNGADDYIVKPITLSQLDEKLHAYAEKASGVTVQESLPFDSIIDYAKQYIENNYMNSALDMTEVANYVSLSYHRFSHIFKSETGISFPFYLMETRVNKSIHLLADPSIKISDISYMVGFKYPQQFSRDFKKITGVYPSEYEANTNSGNTESGF